MTHEIEAGKEKPGADLFRPGRSGWQVLMVGAEPSAGPVYQWQALTDVIRHKDLTPPLVRVRDRSPQGDELVCGHRLGSLRPVFAEGITRRARPLDVRRCPLCLVEALRRDPARLGSLYRGMAANARRRAAESERRARDWPSRAAEFLAAAERDRRTAEMYGTLEAIATKPGSAAARPEAADA